MPTSNSPSTVSRSRGVHAIIGESNWAAQLRREILRVAVHDSTVLITGPTGTGKELIARSIHEESGRAARPFIPVDCTSISGTLFASQLFGHRKGAYTGANYEALGCFRAADRGTIFLDEIGDLELDLQAKLLRVLQERIVVPVGGHDGVPVDVRIVAATNRDLKQEVLAGRFREDLYYRLAVVPVESCALHQRTADIPALSNHFLAELSKRSGMPHKQLTPGALELMAHFPWPGNVRQLRHLLEQAVVICEEDLLSLPLIQSLLERARMSKPGASIESEWAKSPPESDTASAENSTYSVPVTVEPSPHVNPPQLSIHKPSESQEVSAEPNSALPKHSQSWSTLLELERNHILLTLEHTYYNQSAAARLLGITRQSLLRKMKKYQLRLPAAQKY